MSTLNHGGLAASENRADLAALLLRLLAGAWFLVHGLTKLLVFTPAGTAGYFQSLGLPGALGYLTMVLEIAGGLALIAGIATRHVALVLAAVLLGAAWFGHAANGFGFGNPGGGWEYPVFWAVTMLALALLGDGAWSLGKRR
ncbi:DoxX family protein [Paracoccus aminovorans]|uniref:DoxX family protein n=1 Tax=Paracoccus aminovorans TaxID=34004 RepID=UPI0009EA6C7B|nr:DoxX family protein [Paracoccus aminovorans]MDQ7775430.1 DoxX family protein [Paracoccus aminovorans]